MQIIPPKATPEDVDDKRFDWCETLRQQCVDEVINSKQETNDSDLDDEDDANKRSLPAATVTTKKALFLPSTVCCIQ